MSFLASFKIFEDLAVSPRSLRNSQLKQGRGCPLWDTTGNHTAFTTEHGLLLS